MDDKRNTERILLTLPIRVSTYGGTGGDFTEETYTVEINRAGARIALKHHVAPGDTIRIVNLKNLRESDFRVVGPSHLEAGGVEYWGVECLEADRDVWEIRFSPPLEARTNPAGALLKCEDCGIESFCSLRDWELEILKSGALQRLCQACGAPTNWQYADISLRMRQVEAPEDAVTSKPESAQQPPAPVVEKRAHKRVALKLPVLVRDRTGRKEVSKSENISKGGLAVRLGWKLEVGDVITVCCPYAEGGQNLDQRAVVRSRRTFFAGERWIYSLCYIAAEPGKR